VDVNKMIMVFGAIALLCVLSPLLRIIWSWIAFSVSLIGGIIKFLYYTILCIFEIVYICFNYLHIFSYTLRSFFRRWRRKRQDAKNGSNRKKHEPKANRYVNANQSQSWRHNKSKSAEYYRIHSLINKHEHHNVLGIPRDTTDLTLIKTAYKNKMKSYHPDIIATASDIERNKATEMSKRINLAYAYYEKINKKATVA
jgi:hypothetical protein